MSDPQRPPGKTPPRAEPIQPDRPGRGLDTEADDDAGRGGNTGSGPATGSPGERRAEQEESARTNVREGYK
jgi:hypothetical protein